MLNSKNLILEPNDSQYSLLSKDKLRVAFITDLHFSSQTPASRSDTYALAMLEKFDRFIKSVHQKDVDFIFIGGDIFHIKQIPFYYLGLVCERFNKLGDIGLPAGEFTFSIAGNHDLFYGKKETVHKSPSGLLFRFLNLWFNEVVVEMAHDFSVSFKALDYSKKPIIPENKFESTYSVLIAHIFPKQQFPSDVGVARNWEDVSHLGWDVICLGHDHMYYENLLINNDKPLVLRPGAFSRGTIRAYDAQRPVGYVVMDFSPENIESKFISIEVSPYEQVFDLSPRRAKEASQELSHFVKNLKEDFGSVENKDVYSFVELLKCSDDIKSMLFSYLNDFGI